MKQFFGVTACVAGLFGVMLAILGHHVLERPPERPPGWSADLEITKKLKVRLGDLPPEASPKSTSTRDWVQLTAICVGGVVILLAVVSLLRREGVRLGVAALFLGVASVAWEQTLILLLVFIFVGGPVIWFTTSAFGKKNLP